MDVEFVGHPLLDIVKPDLDEKEFRKKFHIYESKPAIALLPGSRKREVELILPVMLKAATIIQRKFNGVHFLIVKAPQLNWDVYRPITHKFKINMKIVERHAYDCLSIADFALVCSGTATLETAIMNTPFLIIYKTSLLNYLLYRPQIKLPYIGLVNIIAGKKIIPEFIQFGANYKKIANQVLETLKNPAELQTIKVNLALIKSSLGTPGAASRAAHIILDFLK